MAQVAHGSKPGADQLDATPCNPEGTLIVIGGNEQKEGSRPILELIAQRIGSGQLVVATLASEEPEAQWQKYGRAFRELGVTRIEQLNAWHREDLLSDSRLNSLEDASVLFFAGGDQMKITTKFGGTPLCDRMRELYQRGATIAGTSSGASVMTEVMMAAGDSNSSQEIGDSLRLAPGLGLISGMIIDQHFAQRGRMGRLLGAVAQNPRLLGLGIDEDTAVIFRGHQEAMVIGSGAAYFIDGRKISHTTATEGTPQAVSIFGVTLHVLSAGDRFKLSTRQPSNGSLETVKAALVKGVEVLTS